MLVSGKTFVNGAIAAGAWILVFICQAGATTYDFDYTSFFGAGTGTGSITTNGTTGILSASDITSWQINVTNSVHFANSFNSSNSTVSLSGNELTATSSQLLFNFSGTDGTLLQFAMFGYPSNVVDTDALNFCDAVAACVNQNSAQSFSEIQFVAIAPGCCSTANGEGETRNVEIAAALISATPLPAALPLFLSGLGSLGLLARRRKRKAADLAAA